MIAVVWEQLLGVTPWQLHRPLCCSLFRSASLSINSLLDLFCTGRGHSANPLVGRRWVGDASLVWIGALVRVGVVHPLCEQATMKLDLSTMGLVVRDVAQMLHQRSVKLPRGRLRLGRQLADELHNLLRRRRWATDLRLQMAEEVLALIAATDHVQLCGIQAVRARNQVIRNDDHRRCGIGLIQGTQGAKVITLLVQGPLCGAAYGEAKFVK